MFFKWNSPYIILKINNRVQLFSITSSEFEIFLIFINFFCVQLIDRILWLISLEQNVKCRNFEFLRENVFCCFGVSVFLYTIGN